jgi:hypothetical protein
MLYSFFLSGVTKKVFNETALHTALNNLLCFASLVGFWILI